jgi:hypothetical protein
MRQYVFVDAIPGCLTFSQASIVDALLNQGMIDAPSVAFSFSRKRVYGVRVFG